MDKQTQKNLLELVKRNYEEIAEDFDITRKEQLWSELVNLAGQIKEGSKILDVGCGNGRLIEAFKNKEIKYLGIDSSEKLVELARKNYELRIKNYEFRKVDILELSKIPEKNFDYVFCAAVLHHLPGVDLRVAALKQLKNKVSLDGKIIITVWNLWSQSKFRKLIFKFLLLKLIKKNKMDFGDILFDWKNNKGERLSQRYYHAFTKRELRKIIKQAGLKIKSLYKDKYNYYAVLTK